MPGGDGTGPAGLGPMTGRAAGYCAGYPVPGFMNPVPGRAAAWFGPRYALPYGAYPRPFVLPGWTPYGVYPGAGRWFGRGAWGIGFARGRGRGWGFRPYGW